MSVTLHAVSIEAFLPMLRNLGEILAKGQQHFIATGRDPIELMHCGLAPDMFPLAKQVQQACDKARNAAARLAGLDPPESKGTGRTIGELQSRIVETIRYIEGIPAAAYEGAEARTFELPLPGRKMLKVNGLQLTRDWMLPNFYFHVVTAYGILRHNGVDLGKRDFLGHAVAYIRQLD
jgi:hypothetical protein